MLYQKIFQHRVTGILKFHREKASKTNSLCVSDTPCHCVEKNSETTPVFLNPDFLIITN